MKLNKSISGISILALAAASCGSTKHSHKSIAALPGTYQSTPIVIDGDSKDWPSPYPNYDAKGMVAYATSNDKENLYITMETGDELTETKILKQGMIVSIDTAGKKSPQFNINYPLPNDSDPLEIPKGAKDPTSQQALHMGSMLDKQVDKATQDANQYSLDGFGTCNGGFMISQTSPCGIKVRVRIDEYKEMVWEAVVPFKAIYNKDQITAADLGKPISVCFAIKGFKKESKSVENSNGGMNQTGTGGMGGGGRGGGMGGGGNSRGGGRSAVANPMDHLYENTKTWKIFGLAYQP
jgi:uncharacterized membrane protein YgcG